MYTIKITLQDQHRRNFIHIRLPVLLCHRSRLHRPIRCDGCQPLIPIHNRKIRPFLNHLSELQRPVRPLGDLSAHCTREAKYNDLHPSFPGQLIDPGKRLAQLVFTLPSNNFKPLGCDAKRI